jgi:hypothetical protein
MKKQISIGIVAQVWQKYWSLCNCEKLIQPMKTVLRLIVGGDAEKAVSLVEG